MNIEQSYWALHYLYVLLAALAAYYIYCPACPPHSVTPESFKLKLALLAEVFAYIDIDSLALIHFVGTFDRDSLCDRGCKYFSIIKTEFKKNPDLHTLFQPVTPSGHARKVAPRS